MTDRKIESLKPSLDNFDEQLFENTSAGQSLIWEKSAKWLVSDIHRVTCCL